MGTRDQQCVDGEWSSPLPVCELIQEASKPAPQTECEKALVSRRLLVVFTAVSPGPGSLLAHSVNICSVWDVFERLGLIAECGS